MLLSEDEIVYIEIYDRLLEIILANQGISEISYDEILELEYYLYNDSDEYDYESLIRNINSTLLNKK